MDQYNGGFDFNSIDLSVEGASGQAIEVSDPSISAEGSDRWRSISSMQYGRAASGKVRNNSERKSTSSGRNDWEEAKRFGQGNADLSENHTAESRNPFDLYCAELRRLEKLDPEEELKLQVRLTEISTGLIRAIANIPESGRLILNQIQQQNGPSNEGMHRGGKNDSSSDAENEPGEISLLEREEDDDFGERISKAELMQGISDSESIEKLRSILEDLYQAVNDHGADHEITEIYREALARTVSKFSLSPSLFKCLTSHLALVLDGSRGLARSIENENREQKVSEKKFEQIYAQSFNEFENFAREASRLYLEWERTRNRISECHVGLVVFLARQYSSDPQELIDLIQEGNIGLLKAVERYNYQLGFRFSTYATYWIRLAMSRYIARSSRAVRLPYRQNLHLGSVRKKRDWFKQVHGRVPTTLELARETGISETNLLKLETMSQAIASLDAQLEVGVNLDLLSMFEQETFAAPHEIVEKQNLSGIIEKSIGRLNQREAYVIRQRFGIGVYAEKTLQELGAVLGLTRERVRQIENGALKKIRSDLEPLAV